MTLLQRNNTGFLNAQEQVANEKAKLLEEAAQQRRAGAGAGASDTARPAASANALLAGAAMVNRFPHHHIRLHAARLLSPGARSLLFGMRCVCLWRRVRPFTAAGAQAGKNISSVLEDPQMLQASDFTSPPPLTVPTPLQTERYKSDGHVSPAPYKSDAYPPSGGVGAAQQMSWPKEG